MGHIRGLNTKLHVATDILGPPINIVATDGTKADCKHALQLIAGLNPHYYFGDKAYDSNDIIFDLELCNISVVISPKSNRKVQLDFDAELHKKRHVIENTFLQIEA